MKLSRATSNSGPKLLWIDLDRQTVRRETAPAQWRRLLVGGRGINMLLLYQLTTPGISPLDPQNPLLIGTGPLTGTLAPGGARCSISGRSPETGLLGDSNIGGFFGPALRRLEIDHLIITGNAGQPTYLHLHHDQIDFCSAREFWGQDTIASDDWLRRKHGRRSQTLVIGPAGEKLVRFAAIRHSTCNTAGRTGMGCLMGAKHLKAIVVTAPAKTLPVAQPEIFSQTIKALRQRLRNSRTSQTLRRYGTLFLYDLHNRQGVIRTRNGQQSQLSNGRGLRAPAIARLAVRQRGCFACPIRCKHVYKIADQTKLIHTLEYGVMGALGPICGINSREEVLKLSDLVNRMGLDASSTGNLIAWVIELFQRGIIDESYTGGLILEWGNYEVLSNLIKQIVEGRDLGAILAQGARQAVEKLPPEAAKYLIWSKGLPQSDSVDLRAFPGFALGVATASRGADHLRSRPTTEAMKLTPEELRQIYGQPVSTTPDDLTGKALTVWHKELEYAVGDALGICRFVQNFNSEDHLTIGDCRELLTQVTGEEWRTDELWQAGERITTLEHIWLLREGLSSVDDSLPERYLNEALPDGPKQNMRLNKSDLEGLKKKYYHLHGWHDLNSNKSLKDLKELGLNIDFM